MSIHPKFGEKWIPKYWQSLRKNRAEQTRVAKSAMLDAAADMLIRQGRVFGMPENEIRLAVDLLRARYTDHRQARE